ncbi:glycosyltransferase family 4 protein [Amaricoccus tamworthensis]|uniref:glycosyltransferase family 4 protein n=1 Tax=Amaricoccus tamworthensis TaxID=57002 RepID=UPI003C79C4F8
MLRTRTDFDYKVVDLTHFRWLALPYKRQHMASQEKLYRHLDPIGGFHGFLGRSIRAEIAAYGPDLVHFSAQYPSGALHSSATGPVFTVALDATRPNMERQVGGDFWNSRDYRREAEQLRNAAMLFPWSSWAGRSLVEDYGIPEDRIQVVFPPIDPSTVGTAEAPGSDGLPNIAFIGNDFLRKGGDLLVDWVTGPLAGRCKLHIMSRDPVTRGLERPGIVVHGQVPHSELLGKLLPGMSFLCHPTQADMSAYVVIEASFAGLPSVASAIGGIPELIINGETGWTLAPDDHAGFLKILEMLIANPQLAKDAGQKALIRANTYFNSNTNFNRMFDIQIKLAMDRRQTLQYTAP